MRRSMEKRVSEVPVVVLDTETTGLFPGLGHRIVEIAALRLEPGPSQRWQVTAEFSQLVQPGRNMDPGASRVNRIFDEDLVDAPPFVSIADELLELLDDAVLVAHNARFDAGFLGMELYIRSLTMAGDQQAVLPNPWLCTLELARRQFHFGRNKLGHVARVLGVRSGRAHRALNDVYVTTEVLKRMVRELASFGLESVGDLLHAQGGAIYTPRPPKVVLPPPIQEALAGKRALRIRYLGSSGESERMIDPLYPTEYEGRSYLIAYCHLRQAQRTFRLDRIFRAEITSD